MRAGDDDFPAETTVGESGREGPYVSDHTAREQCQL